MPRVLHAADWQIAHLHSLFAREATFLAAEARFEVVAGQQDVLSLDQHSGAALLLKSYCPKCPE